MQKKKILCFILTALLLFCYAAPAFAETTKISDEDIPYDFFEYYSGGSWHDLNTPVHRDSSGNYAYCLDHEKEPPGSSTVYSDFDAAVVFNPTTIRGIQAILDHGYPVSTGGIGSSKAHYATANAIRWWIKESTGIGYNFMTPGSSNLRAKSDAADCWAFAQELLGYARAGATTGGSNSGGEIVVSNMNLTWQLVGGQLQASLTIQAPDGYTITPSTNQISISGYTGGTRDTLTITAPLSLMGTDVSLFIQGKGSAGAATSASLYWFEPNQSAKQRVVVTRLTSGGEPDSGYVYITGEFYELTINKTDSYTGAALDGATFQLTTGGRAVGLTQTGAGRYTADGSVTTFTTSGGTAVISGLPAGDYQLVEVSAPSTAYSVAAPGAIRLYSNGTATVPNTPTKVVVQKTNGLTGQPMPGVTFTLTDTSGNPIGLTKHADGTYRPSSGSSNAFTVDSTGKATIMYLPKGKYIIHEPASDGYAELGSETFEVDGVTTIEAVNEPLMLKLTKVDSFTGKTLPNIPFDLLDAAGNSVKLSKVSDGVYH
ncbi:hypothetical protein LJC27_05125, partial [Christensenellaceae bacterium OttesenSCG-928-M15]|nr:hypothetical protein [Christensenellaceae bacterium OttesenSCG-928-M15]